MTSIIHLSEDDLVLHHYNDSDERGRAASHLLSCPECRERYERLREMLGLVDDLPVPERPGDYEARVWEKLEPRIRFESRPEPAPIRTAWSRRWGLAAAMVLMIGAAFVAGRYWQVPIEEPSQPISASTREKILLVTVGSHLERSRMMLVELVNLNGSAQIEDKDLFDISDGRQRAQDLVAAGRIYRSSAVDSGDATLAWVLEELERTLLEIAHSPDEISHAELERLQKRVEEQGILFKVRVIGDQVDQQVKKRPGRT